MKRVYLDKYLGVFILTSHHLKKKKKFPVQTEDQYAQSFITFEEIHPVALWLLTPVKHWNPGITMEPQQSPLG